MAKDCARGRPKKYDGALHLWAAHDWIVLKAAKGVAIKARKLHLGERIDLGIKVSFQSHCATVGIFLKSTPENPCFGSSSVASLTVYEEGENSQSREGTLVDQLDPRPPSLALIHHDFEPDDVQHHVSLDLDYSKGKAFA